MSDDTWQKLATDAIELVRGWEIDHRCNDCPPTARLVDLHHVLNALRERQGALERRQVIVEGIRPRGKSWVEWQFLQERLDWVVIDEVSNFEPEAFDRVRSIREDRARRDWMHAAGMV